MVVRRQWPRWPLGARFTMSKSGYTLYVGMIVHDCTMLCYANISYQHCIMCMSRHGWLACHLHGLDMQAPCHGIVDWNHSRPHVDEDASHLQGRGTPLSSLRSGLLTPSPKNQISNLLVGSHQRVKSHQKVKTWLRHVKCLHKSRGLWYTWGMEDGFEFDGGRGFGIDALWRGALREDVRRQFEMLKAIMPPDNKVEDGDPEDQPCPQSSTSA